MAASLTAGVDDWVQVGPIRLHVRHWEGEGVPFVLLHGLASNCLTWEVVAQHLNLAGHTVITVDQRGHGLSDKPEFGYGFDEVTADLAELIIQLDLADKPFIAGQSWGGNVVLDFAARYPELPRAIALVDGGFIEPSSRPDWTWEQAEVDMRPPDLIGTPRDVLVEKMRGFHPDWTDDGIEHMMGNFETLPDGTIRPWLTLERHMEIVRALWDHHPPLICPNVTVPVLICPAESGTEDRIRRKRDSVMAAEMHLAKRRVHWFLDTAHDIHIHRPEALASLLIEGLDPNFYEEDEQ